jgi:hypothetical protein
VNDKHSVDSNSVVENALERDRRRRFHHWAVTVLYGDGGEFQRVYKNEVRARRFAARQEKSPVVETTKVRLTS